MTLNTDILVHAEAGVSTITFNRADKKNSLTKAMYATLADALTQAERDAAVRCVVFQGSMAVFCAGNDIGEFLAQSADGASMQEPTQRPVWHFLRAIATFPKPVIAAVCGPAVGIGATLLLHCDLVYAGDNAAFSLPFVNLGLCPEAASSLLLPRLFGYQRAAQALLLGEPFLAEAALEAGLVNRIVPPAECNALAQAQARKLAAKPLTALMETKRLMKSALHAQIAARMSEESASFLRLLAGPAAREAFTAFMHKRQPDFSGC